MFIVQVHALQERLQQEAEAKQRIEKELDAVSRLVFSSNLCLLLSNVQLYIICCPLSFVYRPDLGLYAAQGENQV